MPWILPAMPLPVEPFVGDERALLAGFLEAQRATLLRTAAGLSGDQLARRAVPPSTLSLLGLLRHVTDVERTWIRRRFLAEAIPPLYSQPDSPDAAFSAVDPTRAEADVAALLGEWAYCRGALAEMSLEATFTSDRWGVMSLRWLYLHLIREYALHTGHAELLRERIDGTRF